jgi:hypothetical protein
MAESVPEIPPVAFNGSPNREGNLDIARHRPSRLERSEQTFQEGINIFLSMRERAEARYQYQWVTHHSSPFREGDETE